LQSAINFELGTVNRFTEIISFVSDIAFSGVSGYIKWVPDHRVNDMSAAELTAPPPSRDDVERARASGKQLATYARQGRPLTLRIRDAGNEETIELPSGAVKLLMAILEDMAAGRAVTIVPQNAELSTQQAADMLNVSRPFLIGLLKEKKLPFRKVGTHRRVRFEDVLRYKEAIDAERRKALDELVAEAQALKMGY
jgi:excisionase family DNA binding protein